MFKDDLATKERTTAEPVWLQRFEERVVLPSGTAPERKDMAAVGFRVTSADGSNSSFVQGRPSVADTQACELLGSRIHVVWAAAKPARTDLAGRWKDAYAAFTGAFDTPIARRKDDGTFAQDARRRLSSFNEEIKTLLADQSTLHARLLEAEERNNDLMRALEVIAVGDSPDPVRDAGDELVALGYWSGPALQASRQGTPSAHR